MLALLLISAFMTAADVANAQVHSESYYYDPAGRLIVVVDSTDGSATYNYDANGNILSVVRAPLTSVVAAQVAPSTAASGAVVTISGTGFGTTANTTVTFNGVAATVTAASSTTLTVTVPSGAASGPVVVTAPAGSSTIAYNFTVLAAAPTVTSVPSGAQVQGATITIGGTGFDPNPVNDVVVFNGARAHVTAATTTSLTVVVPVCVGALGVQVKTAYGTGTSTSFLTVLPASQTASGFQTRVPSSLGSSASLSFDGTGRSIMTTFAASQGQSLLVYFSAASASMAGSTRVAIYAPDGSVLWEGTSINQVIPNFNFGPIPISATGVYSLWITPPTSTAGTATVNFVSIAAPATAALTSSGVPVGLTTSSVGQQMQATLNVDATLVGNLAIQVTNPSGGAPPPAFASGNSPGDIVTVTGPNGQIYVADMWYVSNLQGFFTGGLPVPPNGTGTYVINMVPGFPDVGTLSFTYYNVPAPATPPPANPLIVDGAPVSLKTTVPGQTFALTFTGTAGQTISLLTNNLTGTLATLSGKVTIFNPDGATSVYSAGVINNPYTDAIVLPQSGTYTVMLTPDSIATGGATFQLYNDAPVVATLTPGGVPIGVTTTAPSQRMSLSMPETMGHRVAVLVQFDPALTASGVAISIKTPDGMQQLYGFSGSTGTNFLFTCTIPLVCPPTSTTPLLPQTGNYSVTMIPGGLAKGTATFTAYDVPADASGTVSVGNNATFNLTTPGQGLRATFTGSAGANATFTVTPTSVTPSSVCFKVWVLEPDGMTELKSGQACSGSYSSGSLSLPSSGDYLVVAVPTVPATGTFTVGVTSP